MKRKRFIKIMQSKGLQRNDAERLAREIQHYYDKGLTYDLMSRGTVTTYGKDFFLVKFSEFQALMCSAKKISRVTAYHSPPAISTDKYLSAAPNLSFNFFGDGKPIDEKGKLLKQEICNGGNR